MVLFAPPLCNRGSNYREFEQLAIRTGDMLGRRAPWFRTREELAELHANLHYFQRAVPGVFDLVARTTLRESGTGQGYELRCPREYEAQIWYEASQPAVSVDFGSLRCPTRIIGSDPAFGPDRPRFDYGGAEGVDYEFVPGTTHFLQLEKPEECAAATRNYLNRQGLVENPPPTGGRAP